MKPIEKTQHRARRCDVTDELPNTSASDDKTDVNADVNSVDEQTFVPTDNTDKVFEFGFVVRVKSYDFGA